ncbi:Cysteine-rich membrane protein 2 [Spironucleus salmonicida]|uniref:Cysteine-rich membrane protein 2 n=1 Tax=Spironucleus salmonicida TaxID=348837 RepID=V6LYF5_9EUKA|nr:Cysteine-rich membrane protein 2 [Spironucleus salmonicida]|eukprot:EST49610.1 Cysteine-rich membrane protein 2 [Spironucleus salmonicida]
MSEPKCCDIFCKCVPPQMQSCQCICGFCTCITLGGALCCASACCYGCKRPSCCAVLCAGICFDLVVIWGWIAGIIVGVKMMC